MSATAPGAGSNTTVPAPVSSDNDLTRTPVSIFPPCSRSTAARASVIEREPPRATAHPNRCPAQTSAIPTAELMAR